MSTRTPFLTTALWLGALAPAFAQTGVAVTQPWARATPSGAQTGAAYLTLTSPVDDVLTGVSTPAAKVAELHEMSMDGNVMRMRALPQGVKLPAGQTVRLAPGGDHVMLMNLAAPLKQGQTIRLHLTFQHAAPMDVDAPIAGIGANSAPPH